MKLKDINLLWIFLFAVAFALAYFFIVTSFFQGGQNAKFFDDVPDLLIFIVAFILFVYSQRLKNRKARKLLFLGTGFICLQRLMEIPLQEYQVIIGILPVVYWILPILMEFFGIFLILFGFKEVIK